jgi:hypothetical protein
MTRECLNPLFISSDEQDPPWRWNKAFRVLFMQKRKARTSEADLNFALSVAERSFDDAPAQVRFTSLCLMAVIVSRYSPGDAQDLAEDRLSAALSRISPSPDDLDVIRRFRADGLSAGGYASERHGMARPTLKRTLPPRSV